MKVKIVLPQRKYYRFNITVILYVVAVLLLQAIQRVHIFAMVQQKVLALNKPLPAWIVLIILHVKL